MKQTSQSNAEKLIIHHLIILDKSGSMSSIADAAVSGVNETISSIRQAQKEFGDKQQNYLTLRVFCGCEQVDVYDATPIDKVRDFSARDYRPCCSTPLYDAVGDSLNKMIQHTKDQLASVVVTIITDGMENASSDYSYSDIKHLIARLTDEGWTFVYMGADHDVEGVAAGLHIKNVHRFEHTEEGLGASFDYERRSRVEWNRRLNEVQASQSLSPEVFKEQLRQMSQSYFIEDEECVVTDIFVFGSNVMGHHNGGAAKRAMQEYGAVWGQSEGLKGASYAIPTVGVQFRQLAKSVERFCLFALNHPQYHFIVTAIGCGSAGYSPRMIAPLFSSVKDVPHVTLPNEFRAILNR